jgi:carrier protein
VKYIKSVDGFFGCYRGIAPRICQSIVSQTVYRRFASRNPFQEEKLENEETRGNRDQLKLSSARSGALIRGSQVAEDFVSMAKNTGWEILSVTASTVASQPFYVIAVRSISQFVGRETKYKYVSMHLCIISKH